jgi:hypothetical protein
LRQRRTVLRFTPFSVAIGFARGNGQDHAATQRYVLRSSQGYHPPFEFAALVRFK